MSQHQQHYFLGNSNIVKAILLSTLAITTGSIVTTALSIAANAQMIAQNKETATVQFYCGKAKDSSSKSILPATVVKVSGYEEEPVLIIWKSEAFSKYTPQQRCEVDALARNKLE